MYIPAMMLKDDFRAARLRRDDDARTAAHHEAQRNGLAQAHKQAADRLDTVLDSMDASNKAIPHIQAAMDENRRSGGLGGMAANLLAWVFLLAKDSSDDARLALAQAHIERLNRTLRPAPSPF